MNSYKYLRQERRTTSTHVPLASLSKPMKFRIRYLMLVMGLVAVALGWFVDHRQAAKREAEWEKAFAEPMRQLATPSIE